MSVCQLPGHPARFQVKKKLSWAKAIPLFCSGTIWSGWTVQSRVSDEVTGVFSGLHFHLPLSVLRGTYLPCYGHSVEDVPQHDPHHHLVPEVEDDTFAVVLPLGGGPQDCRIAGRNRNFQGLGLCLTLWSDTSSCGQPPKQTKSVIMSLGNARRQVSFDTCFRLLQDGLFFYTPSVNAALLHWQSQWLASSRALGKSEQKLPSLTI